MKKAYLLMFFLLLIIYGCQSAPPEEKPLTNEDYRQMAIAENNPITCGNIQDPALQQQCEQDVQQAPLDIGHASCQEQCESNTDCYNNCIIQEAATTKNARLCDFILNEVVKEICTEEANK